MADFTKQYTKGFAVALVKDSLDGEKKVAAPDRRLRKFEPSAPVLQSEVQFSSDGGKKTKSVFWVINSKYNIDVYEKQKDLEAGKSQRTLFALGITVPGTGTLLRSFLDDEEVLLGRVEQRSLTVLTAKRNSLSPTDASTAGRAGL
jgi:hypothetical protein